jgi:NAD(P)-dependent dehydrogenase (short-subunit alcohol dehydrogenase family)
MHGNERKVPIDLRGQVALVSGAGQGIGRAVARALAAVGAAVGVNDVTTDRASETAQLTEAAGGRGLPLAADVSDRNAVDDMVQQVERELGAPDLLVNNAGIAGTFGPWRRMTRTTGGAPWKLTCAVRSCALGRY